MKIIRFEAENVKKLVAVEIEPDGNMVVVGGKNGAGKSSVLDAILVALAGGKKIPPKVLRDGAKKGFVELDLGDFTVRRTFTASGGGTLKITNKDNAILKSPQALLDSLVGKICFDPLEFVRMDSKAQINLLKEITGLDFSELDKKRAELYERRTEVGREGKQLKARCDGLKESLPEDVPEAEVSIIELVKELDEAQQCNSSNANVRSELDCVNSYVKDDITECKVLEDKLVDAKERLKNNKKRRKELQTRVTELKDVDEGAIKAKIQSADSINKTVALAKEYKKLSAGVKTKATEHRKLADAIQEIDSEKERRLAESKLPVKNLAFDENGVTLNGLPFEQASGAEQLKTSVAVGFATSPKLKVLLIKDGSLLDADNLKLLGKMAEKADAQIWIERVGDGAEVSVLMEDGAVKE